MLYILQWRVHEIRAAENARAEVDHKRGGKVVFLLNVQEMDLGGKPEDGQVGGGGGSLREIIL